jgi:hypothetical protein
MVVAVILIVTWLIRAVFRRAQTAKLDYSARRCGVTASVKKLLFRTHWFVMTDRQKYGYLWLRTVKHLKKV